MLLFLRKYRIYSCRSRDNLYQLFTLKVWVRLNTRIAWKRALWLVQAHIHTRAHLRDTRVPYCVAWKRALWLVQAHIHASTFTRHTC